MNDSLNHFLILDLIIPLNDASDKSYGAVRIICHFFGYPTRLQLLPIRSLMHISGRNFASDVKKMQSKVHFHQRNWADCNSWALSSKKDQIVCCCKGCASLKLL